jgi:hypothetical protein
VRGAKALGVAALVGAVVLVGVAQEAMRPGVISETATPLPSFICWPAVTAEVPGNPACGDNLLGYDFAPVAAGSGALTGVHVASLGCGPGPSPRQVDVILSARFDPQAEGLYEAWFEWEWPEGPGIFIDRGVSDQSAPGLPVGVQPDGGLTEGVEYRWRVQVASDQLEPEPWSEWFPFTPAC